jgi:hypothetical protein
MGSISGNLLSGPISVTSSETNVTFQFFESECLQLTNCGACNSKPGCDWYVTKNYLTLRGKVQ